VNAWLEILAQMRATYTNVISSIRKKKNWKKEGSRGYVNIIRTKEQ